MMGPQSSESEALSLCSGEWSLRGEEGNELPPHGWDEDVEDAAVSALMSLCPDFPLV